MTHPDGPDRLTRRAFMRAAALTTGTLATGGLLASCDQPTEHVHGPMGAKGGNGGGPSGGGGGTRHALRVPPTASPTGLTLRAAPATVDVGGQTTQAWAYNGRLPGPTLVASMGDRATITFDNGLGEPSITHWHGMIVDHANDGHPHQAVPAGASYAYDFPVAQRACLNWYHPHPHGRTGEQVYRGLAGAFLLRDTVDTGLPGNPLGLPAGAYELPLIVRDATFDSKGVLQFSSKSSGFWGKVPMVNGTLSPYLDADRAVYRFRVLNGCNARVLRLALASGAAFHVIGNDGGLLDRPYPLTEITLSPGERADLLVDFRGLATGATEMLRCLDAGWDVLEFRGTGAAVGGIVPGALSTITPLGTPVRTRSFSFDGMTRINGKVYDMAAVEFTVPLGDVERWVFVTNGNGPHPVHVHGAYFQVQSRSGGRGRLFDWERGWKDTVLVSDGETVEVLIRFTAHRGLYVMHCHQLAHEDAGMMANFGVV